MHADNIPIGQYLERLRLACGISMTALARRSGLNRTALYKCMDGRDTPRLETIRRLAEAMGYRLVLEFEPTEDLKYRM